MNATLLKRLGIALLGLGLAVSQACAAPVLRPDISVTTDIVTVGDMFADAGAVADKGIFRAPAPGTAGFVSVDQVRSAALAAGLEDFDTAGISRVRVARAGQPVDRQTLSGLITGQLHERGLIAPSDSADISFATPLPALYAADQDNPVQLADLAFVSSNGTFRARFALAGVDQPLIVDGRAEVMVKAPFLTRTLGRGAVLGPDDIEMRLTPKRYADTGVLLDPDQIVGKVLRRQSRQGLLIRPNDLGEQQLVSRNDMVTVYLKKGPLTLTIKGQALNGASKGQPVAVLNLASKKTIHGKAMGPGAVAIDAGTFNVAGL